MWGYPLRSDDVVVLPPKHDLGSRCLVAVGSQTFPDGGGPLVGREGGASPGNNKALDPAHSRTEH